MPQSFAVISVSDKTGLEALAHGLGKHAIGLLSTGGTADFLRKKGFSVRDISDYTKFPEMMGGRIKTLHPLIHGGILARRDQDQEIMQHYGIEKIDFVIVNLYPFEATLASGASFEDINEQIDIGGPTLIRAAAKNHAAVTVITRPEDYPTIIEELDQYKGKTALSLRQKLAARAFKDCAFYDSLIADFMAKKAGIPEEIPEETNDNFLYHGQCRFKLRYGENPHQQAALYRFRQGGDQGIANAELLQGKSPSYNNYADANVAIQLVFSYPDHKAACIVKHATPCGVATAKNSADAFEKALACDPVSAFGGIVGFNHIIDAKTAKALIALFLEVVIAPDFSEEARNILQEKPSLRLLKINGVTQQSYHIHPISGGFMVQNHDIIKPMAQEWKIVTEEKPTQQAYDDLAFAWVVAGYARSNAIVLARDGAVSGIGSGQTSRVLAAQIAVETCKKNNITPHIAASDGFFPFSDSLEVLIESGIKAIIQPGGSKRDSKIIDTANKAGIAMIMTGKRHFRH